LLQKQKFKQSQDEFQKRKKYFQYSEYLETLSSTPKSVSDWKTILNRA